jgi:hypothetical protein
LRSKAVLGELGVGRVDADKRDLALDDRQVVLKMSTRTRCR